MAKSNTVPAEAPSASDGATVPRHRSPNYPVYRIDTAIKKTDLLLQEYKRHRVPLAAAAKKIGFNSHKSSSASQAIAALKAYGFIDVHGSGEKRQVSVSESAAKIIGNHSDRDKLLRAAALAPAIHAELHKKFVTDDGLAPDATIRQYMVFDREAGRFNEDVVEPFIRQFKATLQFTGLDKSGIMSDGRGTNEETQINVGDFVQWESQGALQFPEPRRVTGMTDDGEWVFVEGSKTGAPIAEIKRAEPPAGRVNMMSRPGAEDLSGAPNNPGYKPPAPDAKQFALTTDTGDVVVRWPAVLTEEDFTTISGWLDGIKKKIQRSVKSGAAEPQN